MQRSTNNECPSQTQSMGCQELRLSIDDLFMQSQNLMLADAIELLVDGNPLAIEQRDVLVRKCRFSDHDIQVVLQLGRALPQPIAFDPTDCEAMAATLEDFANDNGSHKSRFEQSAPVLIDQKLAELRQSLGVLEATLISQGDFHSATAFLQSLQRRWQGELDEHGEAIWEPRYADQLRKSASLIRRYAEDAKRTRSIAGIFKKGVSDAVEAKLRQQFSKDSQLTAKRTEALRREIHQEIKRRMLDEDDPTSIPSRLRTLQQHESSLQNLAKELRNSVQPLKDSVTYTQLIKDVRETIDRGQQFHSLIEGACEASSRGTREVADYLRRGISWLGQVITPARLAELPTRQAKEFLLGFAEKFYVPALKSILAIDFTEPDLQLSFAKALAITCDKAQPYLRFPDLRSGYLISELYVHCHNTLVRPLVESYRSGNLRFSNPPGDEAFHIPETHVLSVTSNVLGPGHTRLEFQQACYARSEMLGKETFASIHPFSQPLARPLAIAKRPADRTDSEAIFDLALEVGRIVESKFEDKQVFSLLSLDETVRPCFVRRSISRRMDSGEHFIRLLDEPWIQTHVDQVIPNLPIDWHRDLLALLDRSTPAGVMRQLVSLGILQRRKQRYRIAVPYSRFTPLQTELYEVKQILLPGISKASFVNKLHRDDALYCRVVEDLIDAEARRQLPYRRLTPFLQTEVDRRRMETIG
ncbi:MAG: hypothetical protein KDB22_21635 [Planctomycetales bacterium]|nr:hypothetical protein [Planctomycetales bacterium]